MEYLDVLKMAKYWTLEPPIEWMYRKVHGFEPEKNEAQTELTMLPMTGQAQPWHKLPEHTRKWITQNWVMDHPGKTEADFEQKRRETEKKKYAKQLEEARKAKKEQAK